MSFHSSASSSRVGRSRSGSSTAETTPAAPSPPSAGVPVQIASGAPDPVQRQLLAGYREPVQRREHRVPE